MALLMSMAICSCAGPAPIPLSQLADPGARIFNGYGRTNAQCFHCHGPDGTGGFRGPDLHWLVPRVGNARIWDQIENGDGVMPAYKEQLSQSEIIQVVHWMRGGFPVSSPRERQDPGKIGSH